METECKVHCTYTLCACSGTVNNLIELHMRTLPGRHTTGRYEFLCDIYLSFSFRLIIAVRVVTVMQLQCSCCFFSDKHEFLDLVMIYMPPAHAQFIRELRKPPHIRQFGLQRHFIAICFSNSGRPRQYYTTAMLFLPKVKNIASK